jgi:SNF2 family DNA or RNA helicase
MSKLDWNRVAQILQAYAKNAPVDLLDDGQRASVADLARRIVAGTRGVLLADEVGMGKTRIACALIAAVRKAGGRSAIVLPAGLGAQWQLELRQFMPDDRTLLPLRSYDTFIQGFAEEKGGRDTDARYQRELPQGNWSDESVLMISHRFAAAQYQIGSWRRELLSAIQHYLQGAELDDSDDSYYTVAAHRAARQISPLLKKANRKAIADIDAWDAPADEYRKAVMPLIGYGLGRFDLVVIDEAHKARGEDSSLSRLLGPLLRQRKDCFRLGMTATPVELDAVQWIDTLKRVTGGDPVRFEEMHEVIRSYIEVVKKLQNAELEPALVADFEAAAAAFQQALAPYVLRRDKRDDPVYKTFVDVHKDYRLVEEEFVRPGANSTTWLQRFAASEALSHLPSRGDGSKRKRLSMAQGYGFGVAQNSASGIEDREEECAHGDLAEARHDYWLEHLEGTGEDERYTHPKIVAAVALIEKYTKQGRKVLVFGRFTQPLDALTRLLDAREMLRVLGSTGSATYWPAEVIREGSEDAMSAALQDNKLTFDGMRTLSDVSKALKKQYQTHKNARDAQMRTLRRVLDDMRADDSSCSLDELAEHLKADSGRAGDALDAVLAFCPGEGVGPDTEGAFRNGVETLRMEIGVEGDDDAPGGTLTDLLDGFAGREGNFARLMQGETTPQTRRTLQDAFNRHGSWPRVLLAQSQVGREGLNLHRACRVVVLLHPEWNPGVTEQQIGRVDRKDSLWMQDVSDWKEDGCKSEVPRIMVHPIIVEGTYDHHNWTVLEERWKHLRAQLHGDVLPDKQRTGRDAERIRSSAPRFRPS